MVGNIFLAEIRFSDDSLSKIRPILLIRKNSYGDFIFLPLTTNLKSKGILIESSDLVKGFLPKKSIVITEKISIISPILLINDIATLKVSTFKRVINEVCLFISKGNNIY